MSERGLTPLEGRILQFQPIADRKESGLLTLMVGRPGEEERRTYIISLLGDAHTALLEELKGKTIAYLETARIYNRGGRSYEEKTATITECDGPLRAVHEHEFRQERLFR